VLLTDTVENQSDFSKQELSVFGYCDKYRDTSATLHVGFDGMSAKRFLCFMETEGSETVF
jgi:hypothetical protein